MEHKLTIYNTLTRTKQIFKPLKEPYVGMYVCGPTVYGDAHLGHARAALTFDTVFRFLKYMNYKVRYVRNITDVGHLENDADSGEDKIAKKARLEQLEPMEVAQYFTQRYLEAMDSMNILRPSIQPTATGHIIDQIQIVEKLLENGYAYISNGSVYFDVLKYNADTHKYGILSNRVIDEMIANTRELDGQEEKRNPADFALWKKASPEHIMRWPSPWSDGFPGWHLECTAMSRKYLGEQFDIHGGGLDLLFPHHESEIAQSICAFGKEPAKYWLHNNMITIGGQKMGKTSTNELDDKKFTHTIWETCTECIVVFPDGIGVLPWMLCGNNEIGIATAKKMEEYRLVVWGLHGIYGAGKDMDETFGLIETVEKAAQLYMSIAHLPHINTIRDEELKAVADAFGLEYRKDFFHFCSSFL